MKSDKSQKISFIARVLISFSLIFLLLRQINTAGISTLLGNIRIDFFILLLLTMILDSVVMAWRWIILLQAKEIRVPLMRIIKIYFLSTFVGIFIPSSIGADTIRAYSLAKYTARTADSVSSIVVDRILSLFALLLFAFIGILFFYDGIAGKSVLYLLLILALGFTVALLLLFNRDLARRFRTVLAGREQSWIFRSLKGLYHSIVDYRYRKRYVAQVALLALFIQGLRIFTTFYAAMSLNLHFPLIVFFIYVPLITIITLLPVSVGGIGVQEGAFVYFFTRVGMSSLEAFTLSALLHVIIIVFALPGGVVYLIEGLSVKSEFQTE